MKKIIIGIAVMFMGMFSYSQNYDKEAVRENLHRYFKENINPFLVEQQTEYMNVLTEDEKEIIEKFRAQHKNRPAWKSHGKKRQTKSKDGNYKEMLAEIVENHKAQNVKYANSLDSEMEKWKEEMKTISDCEEYGNNGEGRNRFSMFFERISKPEALLMWNENITRMGKHNYSYGVGQHGKRSKKDSQNPELRSEIKEYIRTEIAPVILEERQAFDAYLSDSERQIIEEARQKIEVRRQMFKAWYGSEDFEPGKRAKDPNFDSMREDMRESIKQVRDIAENHEDELHKSFESMKENKQKWMTDIRGIAQSYFSDPRNTIRSSNHKYQKFMNPVKFLLISPNNKIDELLNEEDDVRVFVYPNPFSIQGKVVITGAIGQKAEVALFSQNGDLVKKLHDGPVDEDRFEIVISSDGLKDKLYIVNVRVDDNLISRKVILE